MTMCLERYISHTSVEDSVVRVWERIWKMFKITHLKEVAVGDNGERFGDRTATHLLEGQKRHGQVDIHEMR
ncbi:unnamed protein product [Prunus armeniaca]|uniref:Uncharacterized protein n=1 Tax=Prunus armeniaca TaxID=36596 RepID=A0A6J5XDD1_PRUAR|nr:unnamed protein product [Prunus armeniaca]